MTIGIVATLKIKDGKQGEFEAVFKELQAQVRAKEARVMLYDFFRAEKDPCVYVILEQYEDQAALDTHMRSAHFAAAGPKIFGCLDGAPRIERLEKIS